MSKHMPSAWFYKLSPRFVNVFDEKGELVARFKRTEMGVRKARLIAAAPDLLSACKEAYNYVVAGCVAQAPGESLGDKLEAAIAEAEG